MKKRILILCTGNSCRSQMAEGFLKSLDQTLEVYSAGTAPSSHVHPLAVRVMQEAGIDIDKHRPKGVEPFTSQTFDYVITVCGNARENCPIFVGQVDHRLHIGFEDPAEVIGTDEHILAQFRRIRDEIKDRFYDFYRSELKH